MHGDDSTIRPKTAPAKAPTRPGGPRRVASKALFAGVREIVIDHAGREYRLRITQNDKLILTA